MILLLMITPSILLVARFPGKYLYQSALTVVKELGGKVLFLILT